MQGLASSAHASENPDSVETLRDFGNPRALQIPSLKIRLELMKAINKNDHWLARANSGHYITLRSKDNDHTENILIYARKGWYTINSPSDISTTTNLFLETDHDWRYMFRVVEHNVIRLDGTYVVPDSNTPTLFVVIEDKKAGISHIIRAKFVNLQAIQR